MGDLSCEDRMKKIVTIIPARGGSKGIPKKNLIEFSGRPLLYWSISQSLNTSLVDETYVTSDSVDILECAKNWGAIPIRRPDSISGDTASSESALLHAIEVIGEEVEMVVFLQATSPLRKPDDINRAIEMFKRSKFDSIFSGAVLEDFLVWSRQSGKLSCLNANPVNRARRQDRDEISYVENGSIYITTPDRIRKTKNRINGKVGIFEMELWQSFEIDDLAQAEFCELLFNHYLKKISNR